MKSGLMRVRGAPITLQAIEQLEKKIGTSLPKDYKKFLLQYNGGIPKDDTCDVLGSTGDFLYSFKIERFLSIDPKRKKYDIYRYYTAFKDETPPGLLPIAFDKFHNFLYISLDSGRIYFIDRQGVVKKKDKLLHPLYVIAYDFEDFLSKLYRKQFQ